MRKIEEGMYQLDLPVVEPIGQVYAYVIIADKITLIDAGVETEACKKAFDEQLAQINLTRAHIDQIILTHHHYDHWSGVSLFSKDTPIYLHPRFDTVSKIDKENTGITKAALEKFVAELGLPENYGVEALQIFKVASYHLPFSEIYPVVEGDIIPHTNGLEVMETPGHASTQIALVSREKNMAISADVLMHNQNLSVWLEQMLPEDETRVKFMPAYLKTLEKLRNQKFTKLYPGHGVDIVDIDEQIEARLAHLEKKKAQVLKWIPVNETKTPWEIYQKLYSARFIARFFTLTFAETVGILDLLQEDGEIEMDESVTPFQVRRSVKG